MANRKCLTYPKGQGKLPVLTGVGQNLDQGNKRVTNYIIATYNKFSKQSNREWRHKNRTKVSSVQERCRGQIFWVGASTRVCIHPNMHDVGGEWWWWWGRISFRIF